MDNFWIIMEFFGNYMSKCPNQKKKMSPVLANSSSYQAKCGLPAKLCVAVDSFSIQYSTTEVKPCRSQKEQFILTSLQNSHHEAQEPRQTY